MRFHLQGDEFHGGYLGPIAGFGIDLTGVGIDGVVMKPTWSDD